MIATRHGGFPVRKGDKLAGTRIIPLVIKKDKMAAAKEAAGPAPLLDVHPFGQKKAGVVTTGNEVFHGRIEDTFTPVIESKLAEYGAVMAMHTTLADDPAAITAAIQDMLAQGMDMVFCTGGMSVDADDKTPGAIRSRCRRIAFQGTPALPGAMLMLGFAKSPKDGRDVAVIGAPACVAFDDRTALDKLLPFIFAGIEPGDLVRRWGVGGLCEHCAVCHYPACSFAAGS